MAIQEHPVSCSLSCTTLCLSPPLDHSYPPPPPTPPFQMAVAIGTKLEYIMAQLALESADVAEGCVGRCLKPRDSLFWFHKPELLLRLIHFMLFMVRDPP